MNKITIKTLAAELQSSVDHLVQQLSNVGIHKSVNDSISNQEKEIILLYLNRKNSFDSNKLMLQRKTRSTLNILGTSGKRKSIQIEVRRKRTFIECDQQEEKKIHHITEEIIKSKPKVKFKYETTKKTQQEVIKTKKSSNRKMDGIIKNAKINKVYNDNEITRKYKLEDYHNFDEKVHNDTERNKNNWENIKNLKENSNNYHIKTSYHEYQIKDDDHEIEGGNRGRNLKNAKVSRTKKVNKKFEFKVDREEVRSVVRSSKNNKHRNSSVLQQSFQKPEQTVNRNIIIGETITVSELANKMAIKCSQVIKVMMKMGAIATINQIIDQKTAQLVAQEIGHKVILHHENELEEAIMNDRDTGVTSEPRAPVVTIMGHVDHGKTTLLDYIRSTKVASREAGGITQHIGAHRVETKNGAITFLDTPGHTAFTAMRTRGVKITDIIVLVIAADDGVMPQTVEAIQHAKSAEVPVIVAINKIDKPEANPDRIKNELARYDILPEEWNGDCQFVCVSAKTGIGIDELLDAILLQAEILELKAVRTGMASGVIIESFLDKGRGPVATVLVRKGTLKKGDIILCGFEYGRIRAMINEMGQELLEAGPSIPVEILGLSGVPVAGNEIIVVRDEKKAREVALYRQSKFREMKLAHQQKSKLENIFVNMNENNVEEINIVLKADLQGTVEAISNSLLNLSTDKAKINIIYSGVGEITETDAILARSSNAILVGFNVRANVSALRIIEAESLNLHYYSVIYDLINEMKVKINDIATELRQQVIGLAEVRNVFKSPKFGSVAGCIVTKGVVKRYNPVRILRDNIVVYEGKLESLRRFKDDINEVYNGTECGVGVKNYNDIRAGDMIEVFEII